MPAPPASTAACTARASGAPQTERGPPYAATGPSAGQSTVTASVGVPVPAIPSSPIACAFASVAVATALTSAASPSRAGTYRTMLTVPTRCPGATGAGAAAQTGVPSPTVAQARTPVSVRATTSATSTPVSRPTPGPARPSWSARPARWSAGSSRSYDIGTVALTTHRRSPMPPPSGAELTARSGRSARQTSSGTSRPPSWRVVSRGSLSTP